MKTTSSCVAIFLWLASFSCSLHAAAPRSKGPSIFTLGMTVASPAAADASAQSATSRSAQKKAYDDEKAKKAAEEKLEQAANCAYDEQASRITDPLNSKLEDAYRKEQTIESLIAVCNQAGCSVPLPCLYEQALIYTHLIKWPFINSLHRYPTEDSIPFEKRQQRDSLLRNEDDLKAKKNAEYDKWIKAWIDKNRNIK